MNIETILKETDVSGVYIRRIVQTEAGDPVSDERIKKDPTLTFSQPPPALIDAESDVAEVSVTFQLFDVDGAPRTDTGAVQFRLRDRDVPEDEGVVITRELTNGALALTLQIDAPGELLLTLEPPFLGDMLLPEPVRIRVVS